jgi:hypothetical protein
MMAVLTNPIIRNQIRPHLPLTAASVISADFNAYLDLAHRSGEIIM